MTGVRNATADDADAIAGVSVRAWRHAYRGIIEDHYLESLDPVAIAGQVREITREGTGVVLVAADPVVLGFSWLSPSRDDDAVDTAEIAARYVDPIVQRQGLGRALLAAHRELA